MAQVADGSVQRDHVTRHHVEAKLFDGGLDRLFVLWAQDERLGLLPWTVEYTLWFRFLGLKVPQDAVLQHGAGVRMCVGFERDILLLDHLLLIGLLLRVLRLVLGTSCRE